ncbi:MAG: hypothetical protein ACLFS9_09770 [Nitriliruptoraceae bacterium]
MTAPVGGTPRRRRPHHAAVAVLVLLAVSCTGTDVDPEPVPDDPPPVEEEATPSPVGRDVEVVLPPATALEPAVLDGLESRLGAVGSALPEELRSLHVRRPDTSPFVGDLLELAAARRVRLACVLGPGTRAVADTVAQRHGATTVCQLSAAPPPTAVEDDDADVATAAVTVQAPVFELGLLVGTAARLEALARTPPPPPEPEPDDRDDDADTDDTDADDTEADGADDGAGVESDDTESDADDDADADADEDADDGADPEDEAAAPAPAPPAVGLVLAGDELDPDAFRSGLLVGLGGIEAIEVADADATPEEAVTAVVAAGAEVVVLDGGLGAAEALAAIPPTVAVLAPGDLQDDRADGPEPVLAYRMRWERLLEEAITRTVDGDLEGWQVPVDDALFTLVTSPQRPLLASTLQQVLDALVASGGGAADTAPPAAPDGGARG